MSSPQITAPYYRTTYSAAGLPGPAFRTMCRHMAPLLVGALYKSGADAVAVRGTSGLSVAYGVLAFADVPFLVMKKSGESSHSGKITLAGGCEDTNSIRLQSYIILDDLISSGNTVRGMISDLPNAECKGILLYEELIAAAMDKRSLDCPMKIEQTCMSDDHVQVWRIRRDLESRSL